MEADQVSKWECEEHNQDEQEVKDVMEGSE